jgi:hypothetical protein
MNYLNDVMIGEQIVAKIADEEVTGIVTGFGVHKGKLVIDLFTGDDSYLPNRFVYPNQVISVVGMISLYNNVN